MGNPRPGKSPTEGMGVQEVPPTAILSSLSICLLVFDAEAVIRYANPAAEQLFELSAQHLCGMRLESLIPGDSTIAALIRQGLLNDSPVSEFGATLDTLRTGLRTVTVHVSPMVDSVEGVLVSLIEHTAVMRIGQQLNHRNAARSVTAMAAILAHEIKNPLSGIRGAAQLLEAGAAEEDRPLAALTRDTPMPLWLPGL